MNNYDVLGFDKEKELTHLYNKGFDELREQSLEDVYNVLCKNEPSKNSKKHKEWSYLESIAYEELLEEDERPHDCTKIINEIVDYLEKEWKYDYDIIKKTI